MNDTSLADARLRAPALSGDEPIMPHMQAWPVDGRPTLLDLMMAFSTYAVSTCSVREDRMAAIYHMIEHREYAS